MQKPGPIEKRRTLGSQTSPIPKQPLPLWNLQPVIYLIGLLVPSHHAHSLYEGVSRVVHSSLDALVQSIAIGRHLVTELGIDGGGEAFGHAVVVLAKVWVVCAVGRRGALSQHSEERGL